MDTLTPKERSERMSRVQAKDTKPEMVVRRLVYGLGYRYRLHVAALPGKPDLVFPGRKSVIFVHGCFWHRHDGCKLARLPKSRLDFWIPKLEANVSRDLLAIYRLKAEGWRVMVVWECQTKDASLLSNRIQRFLQSTSES